MSKEKKIEFHDKANGGWYCNTCEVYLHPDLLHSHICPIDFRQPNIFNPTPTT